MANGSKLTNEGVKIAMDRTFNSSPTYSAPTVFQIGRGTSTPSIADTELEDPYPISGTDQIDDCETADWTDSADMTTSLNSSIYKEGSNGLNLIKDGTASANANTYKTTTSLNFTSKELQVWIYIKDSTAYAKLSTSNCLTIRFGSDSSNYFQWTKDKSDLAVGWNLIQDLTSATGAETGSVTLTSCDYTFTQLTADAAGTTWSAGDFVMDDLRLASADDFNGTFEVGYPSINETSKQVTSRAVLNSMQANGANLTEFGIFNTDSPAKMWSHDVFTAISKTDTEELRIVQRDTFSNS